jgi:hypothetical protein
MASCKTPPNKPTTEKFIEKAKKKHGDKFDYSKVIYKTCKDKVIICNIDGHGEFETTPEVNNKGKQQISIIPKSIGDKKIRNCF